MGIRGVNTVFSLFSRTFGPCPSGGIGRRAGLKRKRDSWKIVYNSTTYKAGSPAGLQLKNNRQDFRAPSLAGGGFLFSRSDK